MPFLASLDRLVQKETRVSCLEFGSISIFAVIYVQYKDQSRLALFPLPPSPLSMPQPQPFFLSISPIPSPPKDRQFFCDSGRILQLILCVILAVICLEQQ